VAHPLSEGVYESLRTKGLDSALDRLVGLTPRFAPVEDADQPHVLARHVASAVERVLADEPDADRRRALVNDLLLRLAAEDANSPPTPNTSSPSPARRRPACTGWSGR